MMAACSVASRSSHARKDIAASEMQEKTAAGKQQESVQPDSTVQDKTPGPVIKEVHHPVKRPASVRDSLSAADSALMAPRPTVSDSLQVQSDTLQTDSTKTEKPLFKDVVEYNAADSIILDVPNKKTFLYKNAFGREWIMLMCTKKIDKSWERCYSVHVRSTKECLTGFCLVWGCQIN